MHKTTFAALAVLLGGCLLPALTPAQQSSAPPTQQAPASGAQPTSASKTQKAPAGKPGATDTKTDSAPLTLETKKDKLSYAIGINLGKGIHKESVEVDPEVLARGLRDGLNDAKPAMTDEEIQATLAEVQKEVMARQQEVRQQTLEKNKKEGEAFLGANKSKPGVVVLPSGLQYKILQTGTGPKPAASDTVNCNYRGTLIDGTEFDASSKHGGQPATFPVSGVIKGWTEALQLMPVGSKWELFIPPDLAYGDRGTNGPIGPNSTLVFEVELVSIQPKAQPAAGAQPQVQRPQAQATPPPQSKPQAQ